MTCFWEPATVAGIIAMFPLQPQPHTSWGVTWKAQRMLPSSVPRAMIELLKRAGPLKELLSETGSGELVATYVMPVRGSAIQLELASGPVLKTVLPDWAVQSFERIDWRVLAGSVRKSSAELPLNSHRCGIVLAWASSHPGLLPSCGGDRKVVQAGEAVLTEKVVPAPNLRVAVWFPILNPWTNPLPGTPVVLTFRPAM